jgi:ABC-type sulfate transport system substrate-binding protein
VIGGGNVSLAGVNFTPNTFVTLRYYKGTSGTASQTWTAAVGCNGKFSTSVKSATTLVTRQDNIKALDTGGRSATAYITVLL